MTRTPSATPSRPPWYQGFALALALAIAFTIAVQLLFGGSSLGEFVQSLAIALVYSLCLAGGFVFMMPLAEQRIGTARFPFNWVLFLCVFTLLIGLGSAVASFILYSAGIVPDRMDWNGLLFINRLVFGVTLVFGIFSFLYSQTKTRLGARNLELQEDLERESRHVRAQELELERAREIQEALLPKDLQPIDGFSLFGAWRPARAVGGDYFDVLYLDDHAVGLCIGDVVGKGISAALLMSNLQAAVKAFASPDTSPAELCAKVNEVITGHVADGKFITFFYGLLDSQSGKLTYSCAGHNAPILVRQEGEVDRLDSGGPVLGIFPARRYEQGEIRMAPGDRLLLFTDGVTEATNAVDEEFGEQRLVSLVSDNRSLGAEQLTQKVLSAVGRFSRERFTDDATLLAMSVG